MTNDTENRSVEEILTDLVDKLAAARYALHRKLFEEQTLSRRAKGLAALLSSTPLSKKDHQTKDSSE